MDTNALALAVIFCMCGIPFIFVLTAFLWSEVFRPLPRDPVRPVEKYYTEDPTDYPDEGFLVTGYWSKDDSL